MKISIILYRMTSIAKFPLENRDDSKLLFLNGELPAERKFKEIPALLPSNSLLVFNETKVIQARLIFQKKTGATIEIFCLEPVSPTNDFQLAFQQTSSVIWKCLVGNAKRWKGEVLEMPVQLNGDEIVLKAEKKENLAEAFLIEFKLGIRLSDLLTDHRIIRNCTHTSLFKS